MSTPKIPRGGGAGGGQGPDQLVESSGPGGVLRRAPDCVAPQASSLQRPDFEDALRRVAAVVHRHIEVCEKRRERAVRLGDAASMESGEFHDSALELFAEANYATPQYKMRFVRLPLGRPGTVYAMQQVA